MDCVSVYAIWLYCGLRVCFPSKTKLALAVLTLITHLNRANFRLTSLLQAMMSSDGQIQRRGKPISVVFRMSNTSLIEVQVALDGLPQKPTRHLSGVNKTDCHVTASIDWLQSAPNPPQRHHIIQIVTKKR